MEDIKKYAVKEHIPTVNEGIEEGRLLVHCKDCENWDDVLKGYCTLNDCFDWDADDFCSRGEKKVE